MISGGNGEATNKESVFVKDFKEKHILRFSSQNQLTRKAISCVEAPFGSLD